MGRRRNDLSHDRADLKDMVREAYSPRQIGEYLRRECTVSQ